MTEEPYRWLEAIANRREYIRDQLKPASPVLAASLKDGIVLLGVGTGQSKVFEIFDRQALTAMGHPADIERIRQSAIDAAHLEGFTRAPEDVALRRLVGFGLSPLLKAAFEQIFSAPFLTELLFAEIGDTPAKDVLARVHFDGSFELQHGGVAVAALDVDIERDARLWLAKSLPPDAGVSEAVPLMLEAWWCLVERKGFGADMPDAATRTAGWKAAVAGRTIEAGWLDRKNITTSRFRLLDSNLWQTP